MGTESQRFEDITIAEGEFDSTEQTGVQLATDDGKRGDLTAAWEDNGCMPDDCVPLRKNVVDATKVVLRIVDKE